MRQFNEFYYSYLKHENKILKPKHTSENDLKNL